MGVTPPGSDLVRADICASDDYESIARLQTILAELGGLPDDSWHDTLLGVGLHTYRFGSDVVTVFIDAWICDVAGPRARVNEIVARMGS